MLSCCCFVVPLVCCCVVRVFVWLSACMAACVLSYVFVCLCGRSLRRSCVLLHVCCVVVVLFGWFVALLCCGSVVLRVRCVVGLWFCYVCVFVGLWLLRCCVVVLGCCCDVLFVLLFGCLCGCRVTCSSVCLYV